MAPSETVTLGGLAVTVVATGRGVWDEWKGEDKEGGEGRVKRENVVNATYWRRTAIYYYL